MEKIKPPSPERTKNGVFASKLIGRRWLSKHVLEIELARPPLFDFKPGQCVCLIDHEIMRYYSVSSAPSDPTIRLCVQRVEDGIYSPRLAEAVIGTQFHFTGPWGYFTFQSSRRSPVFVATGTGIAPFLSMGRSGVKGFIIFHEVTGADDLYYESFFRSIAKRYTACLLESSAESKMPPDTFGGSAAECLEIQLPPMRYDFYLCGRQDMIRDVTHMVDEHFPDSFVFKEVYY